MNSRSHGLAGAHNLKVNMVKDITLQVNGAARLDAVEAFYVLEQRQNDSAFCDVTNGTDLTTPIH